MKAMTHTHRVNLSTYFSGDNGPETRLWEGPCADPTCRELRLEAALRNMLTPLQVAQTHLSECMGEDYAVRLKYEHLVSKAFAEAQSALTPVSEEGGR